MIIETSKGAVVIHGGGSGTGIDKPDSSSVNDSQPERCTCPASGDLPAGKSMEEIINIINKYEERRLDDELCDFDRLVRLSADFYTDVAEIYDAVTRARNIERNPSGFDFNDAAVLGLLVRIWKILKEIVYYYRQNNGQIISHLDRQILEAAIVANYLLLNGDEAIEDYRKCSYKDRLNIITGRHAISGVFCLASRHPPETINI